MNQILETLADAVTGPATSITFLLVLLCGIVVIVSHTIRVTVKVCDAAALAVWKRFRDWNDILEAVSLWKEINLAGSIMPLDQWVRLSREFRRGPPLQNLSPTDRRWLDAVAAFKSAVHTPISTPYYTPPLNTVNYEYKEFLDADAKLPRTPTGEYFHKPTPQPVELTLVEKAERYMEDNPAGDLPTAEDFEPLSITEPNENK